MASLISGYEYDIFISYRQKDNKGDKWVSKFVDALKTELESTFKEEISVYFDINPHDGLLETHDVDASLKEKLKCLVFIPIISRTYCDPKSFAWEHEFKAFIEQASQDKSGMKVKLAGGNIASRVLPVQIHDLDANDKKIIEEQLGGFIRGIEFIYKEPGVNKPLTSDDDEKKNLNGTKYRIQINKVANAIREIIQGLSFELARNKEGIADTEESSVKVREEKIRAGLREPARKTNWKVLSVLVFTVLLIIAGIFAYPKIFKGSALEKLRSSDGRISVAVMPFRNMANDTTLNYIQSAIQDDIISYLANFNDYVKVRPIEYITSLIQSKGLTSLASITPSVASTISKELDATICITGSVKQTGTGLHVNAQLIDSKTEEVYKSFSIYRSEEKLKEISDSLSIAIKDFLLISILKKENVEYKDITSTNSPDAYKCFILGKNAYYKKDYKTAIIWFNQALKSDSNFISAERFISVAYQLLDPLEGAKWCRKVWEKRDLMSPQQRLWANKTYSEYFETPEAVIKCLKQLLEIDDQQPPVYYNLGINYLKLNQFDNAIPPSIKAIEIYDKWNLKPVHSGYYLQLGYAYHKTGQYENEKKLYKKAEMDFPDNPSIIYRQAILSLTERDTVKTNQYIKKYISLRKESSASEAAITTGLAGIYSEADLLFKAEEYYRKALSLQPENPLRLNNFAYFLIDKDINVNEGLKLVDKALSLSPDNCEYLDTKGLGLYKQGKYQEALKFLQKADSMKPIFNPALFLHLDATKNALANQKKN